MITHPVHDSAYSWFRLAVSVLIASIGTVGIWAIVMVMPAMQAEYGVGRGDASLPFTITMIGFAFGNLVFGRMIDRYGVVICQIAAAVIAASGFFAATFAPSIWTMTAMMRAPTLPRPATSPTKRAWILQNYMKRITPRLKINLI